jgi:hypothetical protein
MITNKIMKLSCVILTSATLFLHSICGATLLVGAGRPYTAIQAAINDSKNGDTIEIGPGRYEESLMIQKALILRGAGPQYVTVVAEVNMDAISLGSWASPVNVEVTLNGLTITSAYKSGVNVAPAVVANIDRCVIADCRAAGVTHNSKGQPQYDQIVTDVRIRNCTIANNDWQAVYFWTRTAGNLSISECIISNNNKAPSPDSQYPNNQVFAATDTFLGISGRLNVTIGRVFRYGKALFVTNGSTDRIFVPSPAEIGNGANPRFLDETHGNYILSQSSDLPSLAIDGGTSGIPYLDPDGSRGDLGAYSGPGAARFWPYPIGGPLVTDLRLSQGVVPQGGKITISATASTR